MLLLFCCSVISDSLWPHGLKHGRLPCPSPSPQNCSNSCPSSRWCHPTISSSVVPFSSCLQSFPSSGPLLMRWLFISGAQNIGTSASESVLPMTIQDWFPLGLTGNSIELYYVLPCGSAGKESTCNSGDLGSIPGLGKSPGGGKGYPLQSGLENSLDCIGHGATKSWTRQSNFHITVVYTSMQFDYIYRFMEIPSQQKQNCSVTTKKSSGVTLMATSAASFPSSWKNYCSARYTLSFWESCINWII